VARYPEVNAKTATPMIMRASLLGMSCSSADAYIKKKGTNNIRKSEIIKRHSPDGGLRKSVAGRPKRSAKRRV